MKKSEILAAYETINKIEDLFTEADRLFDKIPPQIQQAVHAYHNDTGTMQHCLRWGLQAAEDIRKDWHTVIGGIPCTEVDV